MLKIPSASCCMMPADGLLLSCTMCMWQTVLSRGPLARNKGRAGPKLLQASTKCESTEGKAADNVVGLWDYVLQALDNWSTVEVFSFRGFTFFLQ